MDKEFMEFEQRRKILESILVSSINDENSRLPTIERYIFNEIIRGCAEYVSRKESDFACHDYRIGNDGKKYWSTKSDYFEPNMWDYFQKELLNTDNKLNFKIEKEILQLLKPYWSSDQTGDGGYETELYLHFKGFGGICSSVMVSSFSLPYELVTKVQNKILPAFSDSERKDIGGIGKSMRKYANRDLEHIKQKYCW